MTPRAARRDLPWAPGLRALRGVLGPLLGGLVSLLAAGEASAQLSPQAGVPVPGRPFAGITDASAVALNPANLALLPSWEGRALVVGSGGDAPLPTRGVSVDLASPLFFDLSGGVRLDFVRPLGSGELAQGSRPYRIATAAAAYKVSERFSVGASLARTFSDAPGLDSLWGATAAATLFPSGIIGGSVAARNWNGHENAAGTTLERSLDAGLVLRPTGGRAVEIGLEAGYAPRTERLLPRATLGLDVPYVGRLRGDVALEQPFKSGERAFVATAGLDVNWGGLQASGGGLLTGGPGPGGAGFYAGLAVRGYHEPGIPSGEHFIKIRVESTPGARSHVRMLRALWRIADDPSVAGVGFVLKTEPAGSFAHAEELGDAIRLLRSRGKKVFCHLEDAAGRSLYMCAQADRVVVNPAGGVHVSGLRSNYMYFGDALSRLGVRADFVRIGAHKTAAEQFTARGPTPTAEQDHRELLAELERTWINDIGGGRGIPAPELRARIARGPFIAREAREAGLVDGYAFDDEIDAVAAELVGHRVRVVDAASAPAFSKRAPDILGERDRVAVIYVDGNMIDGRSRDIPLVGTRLAGSYTIAAAVKQAREDSRVKAIVLRVETPGGSSMAADVIWRELQLAAKGKPLVVSMGGVAASAGYYISSPGTVIFANRTTVTGSIGIFYGKADVEGLLKKIGVNIVTYRTTARADAESFYRPFTEDERQELGRKVKQFYDTFIDRVSRGRKMTPDEVDAVARGKVWTGEQARDRKLVDRLGGLREAITEAERLGGLARGAPLVELPEQPRDLFSTVLSLAGLAQAAGAASAAEAAGGSETAIPSEGASSSDAPAAPLPKALVRLGRALLPFALFEPDSPQARLEMLHELP
jgi:protease IV